MSVVYNQVPQLIDGYVIKRAVLVRKPDAFVGAHLANHPQPFFLIADTRAKLQPDAAQMWEFDGV